MELSLPEPLLTALCAAAFLAVLRWARQRAGATGAAAANAIPHDSAATKKPRRGADGGKSRSDVGPSRRRASDADDEEDATAPGDGGKSRSDVGPTQRPSDADDEEDAATALGDAAAPDSIVFTVNGTVHRVHAPSPTVTLLAWLRDRGHTAAKVGCGEGGCGACTVVENGTNAINSCLRLLVQCDGAVITTPEGLGGPGNYSEEQKAIADGNGSQCGYCTPGWTTALRALRNRGGLSEAELQKALDGNICRCTGYRPILEAAGKLLDVEDCSNARCGDAEGFCKHRGTPCGAAPSRGVRVLDRERNLAYVEPTSLKALLAELDRPRLARDAAPPRPASLVGGATASIGVAKYYGDALGAPWAGGLLGRDATLVSTKSVPELVRVSTDAAGLRVGGAVTIDALIEALEAGGDDGWRAAAAHLRRVANTQVRNSAT